MIFYVIILGEEACARCEGITTGSLDMADGIIIPLPSRLQQDETDKLIDGG